MTAPRVAVVGGGISGLTAAYRLQQRGFQVSVFEAADRPGGKIRTGRLDDLMVEEGPDAFLPRDERAVQLCHELGLSDELVSPAVFGAYIWHRSALRRLPAGSPYGIPRDPKAAWREGLLSAAGAARASLERVRTEPLDGPDVTVADFIRKRFGREVLDHLVDPLLAGVRGGRTDEMSLAAAGKEIDALARARPSVLRALSDQPPTPPGFLAPRGGMQQITDRLASEMHDLRTGTSVREVDVRDNAALLSTPEGELTFDGAVVALPAHRTAEVLKRSAPVLSSHLARITYASVVVITLVYPRGTFVPPPRGSGFLVPSRAGLTISACTWYSTKWPDSAPDGRVVMRCVVGRAGDLNDVASTDDELVAAAHQDLVTTLRLTREPMSSKVTRWERSIPEYKLGHLELVEKIERAAEGLGPVRFAGTGLRGSGIPDCIRTAEDAAASLAGELQVSAR